MKNNFSIVSVCLLVWLFPSLTLAQPGKVLKELATFRQRQTVSPIHGKLTYVGPGQHMTPYLKEIVTRQAAQTPLLTSEIQRVALSDGRKISDKRHSIVPSAVTILGSPAIVRPEDRNISALRKQAQEQSTAQYLSPLERERWRNEWEALRRIWIKAEPSKLEDLPHFLTHQVPPPTLAYLQQEYAKLCALIETTNQDLSAKVIYSFLRNEGHPFIHEERAKINDMISNVRFKIRSLGQSINKDPYLLVQQKYWDRMFGAFNPLLKGVLAKPISIFRQDNREFVLSEFALHNPDGSSPYLPKSDSMIQGESIKEEDDDFDEEQYSGTPQALLRQAQRREAEREHKTQMIQLAEQERAELLATCLQAYV